MKHIKLASAVALVMGVAFAGSAGAAATGGKVEFTGQVNDPTCTVTGGANTTGATTNFGVKLDDVDPADLSAAGVAAKPKQFDVELSGANCTNGITASMSFTNASSNIDAATGALKNANGTATNVQVQLLDDKGAAIDMSGAYQQDALVQGNKATMKFSAQYLAVGGQATAGTVDTLVDYEIDYN